MLISTLDVMMCVFVCLSTIYYGGENIPSFELNLGLSLVLLAIFFCFTCFVGGYGVWRYFKAKKAEKWRDYQASCYVSTLFEGANLQHPERMTMLQLAFIAK